MSYSVRRRDDPRYKRRPWRARYYLGVHEGGPVEDERYFATKAEGERWALDEIAAHRAYGRQQTGRAPTVAAFLDTWLDRGTTRSRKAWSPSTRKGYESVVRHHLKPALGHVRLDELTVDHVDAMLEGIPGGGTAVNVRRALSSALEMAVRARHVPYNVAKASTPPTPERPEIQPLTREEAERFLAHARKHPLWPLYAVAMALALRQSEVVGLRWEDVGEDALTVRQKVYYVDRETGYHTGEPKSQRSKRTIPFPPPIGAILEAHRKAQRERELRAKQWTKSGLVFTNRSGEALYGKYVTRTMQRLMTEAGVEPRRFHDLRHTGASVMLALGVDVRTIQAMLGHADYQLTANTYVHPDTSLLRGAADRIGTWLDGMDYPEITRNSGADQGHTGTIPPA